MGIRATPGKPIVVIDLGPGRGERLERIGRQGNKASRKFEPIGYDSGEDQGAMHHPLKFSTIHMMDLLEGLSGHRDNSVDAILSDFVLGYYVEEGPRQLRYKDFSNPQMDYFKRAAEVAFKKLKPTSPGLSSGRTPTKKYFSIRLAAGDMQEILRMLRGIGFIASARPMTKREISATVWSREMASRPRARMYQINAHKPEKPRI
ncbi:MAG: hypothetical protein ABH863_04580 [Candidatus Micrarchaeota archaeon]